MLIFLLYSLSNRSINVELTTQHGLLVQPLITDTYTKFYSLQTVHFALHTVHYWQFVHSKALDTVHIIHTVKSIQLVHSEPYIIHSITCTIMYTINHTIRYTVNCALWNLHTLQTNTRYMIKNVRKITQLS